MQPFTKMLSLMYILHQTCNIFEDAEKALTEAIQHINIDKVFNDKCLLLTENLSASQFYLSYGIKWMI